MLSLFKPKRRVVYRLTAPNQLSVRKTDYSAAVKKLLSESLSLREELLLDALRQVDTAGGIGIKIRGLFIDYSIEKFRSTVCYLLTVNDREPVTLLKMIGQPAYGLLINCHKT